MVVDLNVFTENKRSVMLIEANLGPGRKPVQVAFVAIGGMCWCPSRVRG
jgi:phosphatidylserine decarboxylase